MMVSSSHSVSELEYDVEKVVNGTTREDKEKIQGKRSRYMRQNDDTQISPYHAKRNVDKKVTVVAYVPIIIRRDGDDKGLFASSTDGRRRRTRSRRISSRSCWRIGDYHFFFFFLRRRKPYIHGGLNIDDTISHLWRATITVPITVTVTVVTVASSQGQGCGCRQ